MHLVKFRQGNWLIMVVIHIFKMSSYSFFIYGEPGMVHPSSKITQALSPQNAINSKPYYSYGRPANLLKIPFRVSLKSRKLSRLTSYLWKNWRKNNTIWSRNPHWYGCTLIPYWSVLVDFRAFQGTYGVFQSSVNFETMLTSAKHEPILKSLK